MHLFFIKIKILVFLSWYCEDSKNGSLWERKCKKEDWRKSQRDCQDCRGAAGDVMQDTKAGNGVTSALQSLYTRVEYA